MTSYVQRIEFPTQQQKIKAEKEKGVRVIWFSLPVLPPILIGFTHNRSWSSGHTRLLICWYLLSEKTKGGGPAPEKEKGGERSKRGPDEASKTQEKMGGKDGDRGRGGTVWCPPASHLSPWKRGLLSLFSPPPYKSNERLSGPFSLLKFLRPNLQCDWSPVTDRTNIRPTVISFLFSFSGWCYCCW
jgi:hypothetical protein